MTSGISIYETKNHETKVARQLPLLTDLLDFECDRIMCHVQFKLSVAFSAPTWPE